MGYRDYSTAKGHIVDATGHGDFSTIQAAITAAVSGQTIFIRPGTYTENLTLKSGVNLVAYMADSETPNVTILGKSTFTGSGNVTLSGLFLQTNGDFFLVLGGSSAAQLVLTNCNVLCSNNTGISYTNSNSATNLSLNYCQGDISTTGIGLYSSSSPGGMEFRYSTFTNSGGSTTASTNSAGSVTFGFSAFQAPITTSSTGAVSLIYSNFNTQAQNATCLTTAGSGTSVVEFSDFISGTAAGISIGAGTIINAVSPCRIDSTNTNPITGAGTLNYSTVSFSNQSGLNIPNVSAMNPDSTFGGGWSRIATLTASASANLTFTNLPVYKVYAVVFNNVLPATNAQDLEFLASSNNGSTFPVTGYTSGINFNAYNSTTVTNATATTYGIMARSQSNGVGLYGTVFFTPGNGGWWGQMSFFNTTAATYTLGFVTGTSGIVFNALRFLFASGNITSGSITLYGLNT